MSIFHPKTDDKGNKVKISHPSTPTSRETWLLPDSPATVIPLGEMPPELSGIAFESWLPVPTTKAQWEALAAANRVDEPPFTPPPGLKSAAGVVVEEPDGRIWLVAPTNAFGGYSATFPKGTIEPGYSLQASAIKEAWEEAGLQVELTGFLMDAKRSTSYTRYYRAKRVGGNPAEMGWESQATHLVPRKQLGEFLTNKNDQPLLNVLQTIEGN